MTKVIISRKLQIKNKRGYQQIKTDALSSTRICNTNSMLSKTLSNKIYHGVAILTGDELAATHCRFWWLYTFAILERCDSQRGYNLQLERTKLVIQIIIRSSKFLFPVLCWIKLVDSWAIISWISSKRDGQMLYHNISDTSFKHCQQIIAWNK